MSGPPLRFDSNILRGMEVFLAVIDMGQVSAAAGALGLTQSAASQHLRNLERCFDVTLFDRSVRPMRLTPAGVILRRRAFRVMNEMADLQADFRRLEVSNIPLLRIGMLPSIATTLTPRLSRITRDQLGVAETSLSASLAGEHQADLLSRKLDLIITSDLLSDPVGLDVFPILKEPFYLVLPKNYTGQTQDVAKLARDLPLVRFSADAPVGRRTDQHLQRLRLDLPSAMEADRSSMVVAGVAAGTGFAILTPSLLVDAVTEGMQLRIEPLPFAKFSRSIHLLARTGGFGDVPLRVARHAQTILREAYGSLFPRLREDCEFHDLSGT